VVYRRQRFLTHRRPSAGRWQALGSFACQLSMDGAPEAARVACCRMEAAMAAAVWDLPVVHEAREAAPIFRLSRSVGQVGTNSETTLGITRFQLQIRAFAGAAPDEFYVPPGHRQGGRGQRCHAPAGRCRVDWVIDEPPTLRITAARIAALSANQAPTAIIGCPHTTEPT
jgi:hypothetical protein